MRTEPRLLAVVAFSLFLLGCGASESSDSCSASKVRIVSANQDFNAFCGQPCTSSSDCPSGMACVLNIFGNADPAIAACVSDKVPAPLSTPAKVSVDMPASICLDSMTLGKLYVNQKTGITGWERIACPQGCQANPGDAGYINQATAHCL